jgi:small subunit ribosomal protein S6
MRRYAHFSVKEVNPLRTYEALFIVQPNATDDEIQTIAKGAETLITSNGGAIVRSEIWGKRRLAYEVKSFQEGVYVLVRFQSPAELVDKLEMSFRLNEAVIRWLVVHYSDKDLRLEAEQSVRDAALAEQRSSAGEGDRSEGRSRRYGRDDRDDDD